jgi:hypothetical protein
MWVCGELPDLIERYGNFIGQWSECMISARQPPMNVVFFSSNELGIRRAGGQGFLMMKRREFITLLGGAAAAWPLIAHAQQKVRLIGVLLLGNADAESFRTELRDGLRKLGYTNCLRNFWRLRKRRIRSAGVFGSRICGVSCGEEGIILPY